MIGKFLRESSMQYIHSKLTALWQRSRPNRRVAAKIEPDAVRIDTPGLDLDSGRCHKLPAQRSRRNRCETLA
jgi:hypothetical protein